MGKKQLGRKARKDGQDKTKQTKHLRQFMKLVRETKPPKWTIGVAVFLSVLSTIAGLIVPLMTKAVVDSFTISDLKGWQMVVLGLFFGLQALASGVSIYLLGKAGQYVVARIRDRLWKKLLLLKIPYYDENRIGESVSRMTNDTAVVKGLITEHVTGLFTGIISIIGAVILLFALDWRMTLLMLLAVPLTALIMFPIGRMMLRISKAMQDETASLTSTLNQALSEIRLVKAYHAEDIEYNSGKQAIGKLFRLGVREGRVQAFIAPVVGFVMTAIMVLLIGYGGMRVSSGALTAGDLVAFILYLLQMIMPINQISTFFTQMQKAAGATERIVETLEAPVEMLEQGRKVTNASLPICVEHLSFAYKTGEPVIKDISFTIEAGKMTAIVGPSGSGKTTLFALLEQFYEPQEGEILLGSDPIKDLTLASWREQIGYVSQESPLIGGTVKDNICYGLGRDVTDDELEKAAAMAYADGFIKELPAGYETEVGERGVKLSGGQRQRIAIARALLRNPQILLLDEATSSLDSKSEQAVQEALRVLMKGRTTIVIAHRLSTVVDADQILFMDHGSITGRGAHEELMRTHTLYHEFARQQLRIAEKV